MIHFIRVDGNWGTSKVTFGEGVTLSGNITDSAITATNGGIINVCDIIGGNVNGRKYSILYGGCINTGGKGANSIPGNLEGICDADSKII